MGDVVIGFAVSPRKRSECRVLSHVRVDFMRGMCFTNRGEPKWGVNSNGLTEVHAVERFSPSVLGALSGFPDYVSRQRRCGGKAWIVPGVWWVSRVFYRDGKYPHCVSHIDSVAKGRVVSRVQRRETLLPYGRPELVTVEYRSFPVRTPVYLAFVALRRHSAGLHSWCPVE